jgi:hypothetical protein
MIGVHSGALAAKILHLGVAHEVKKAISQRISLFLGVLCTPKAAHGSTLGMCWHLQRLGTMKGE